MKFKKCIFTLVVSLCFCLICLSSFASSPYIWTNNSFGLLETVSDTETDLKLESGGAILIEQSSRFCFI